MVKLRLLEDQLEIKVATGKVECCTLVAIFSNMAYSFFLKSNGVFILPRNLSCVPEDFLFISVDAGSLRHSLE